MVKFLRRLSRPTTLGEVDDLTLEESPSSYHYSQPATEIHSAYKDSLTDLISTYSDRYGYTALPPDRETIKARWRRFISYKTIEHPEADPNYFRFWIRTLKSLVRSPNLFFLNLPRDGVLNGAMSFVLFNCLGNVIVFFLLIYATNFYLPHSNGSSIRPTDFLLSNPSGLLMLSSNSSYYEMGTLPSLLTAITALILPNIILVYLTSVITWATARLSRGRGSLGDTIKGQAYILGFYLFYSTLLLATSFFTFTSIKNSNTDSSLFTMIGLNCLLVFYTVYLEWSMLTHIHRLTKKRVLLVFCLSTPLLGFTLLHYGNFLLGVFASQHQLSL